MNKQNSGHLCIHVMPKEKFSKGFIAFTNDAFPDMDVWFVLYGSERIGYVKPKDSNVIFVDESENVFSDEASRELLRASRFIVLNWVDWKLAIKLFPYRRKTMYLFWGGDLYDAISRKMCSPKRLYKAFLLRCVSGVSTLIPGDLEKVELLSKKHGLWHLGMICGLTKKDVVDCGELCIDRPEGFVRVLVGNSATPSNRHIDIFRMLAAYKDKGIEVLVPLSYGEDTYRKKVLDAGRELLGKSFVPLLGFIDKHEYENLLSTVSIGVFNHNRQQGMGNITLLMRHGAKVFVSNCSPMWDDFVKEGRIIFPTEEISKLSFNDFVAYSEEYAYKNYALVNPSSIYRKAVDRWAAIYYDYGVRGDV